MAYRERRERREAKRQTRSALALAVSSAIEARIAADEAQGKADETTNLIYHHQLKEKEMSSESRVSVTIHFAPSDNVTYRYVSPTLHGTFTSRGFSSIDFGKYGPATFIIEQDDELRVAEQLELVAKALRASQVPAEAVAEAMLAHSPGEFF
jgi:hypothetical protein